MEMLVVVHPGSACGSADFNLGRVDARAARDALVSEIVAWSGPVVVVDGVLSDELQGQALGKAIEDAIGRAEAAGHPVLRVFACDGETEDWPAVVSAALDGMGLPRDIQAVVTGAWYFEDGSSGCVNAVYDLVTSRGGTAEVGWSAVRDPAGALDMDVEGEEEDVPPPRP